MADRMTDMRDQIVAGTPPNTTGVIQDGVDQVNALASRIKSLNAQIASSPTSAEPFDLLDQRTVLIRELSELTDIYVAADFTITIGVQTLVTGDGATINTLAVSSSTTPVTLTLGADPDATANPDVTISGGSLGAWIDVAATIDDVSGSMQLRLDTLADTLMTAVNALHTTGYDLNGDPGITFFTGADNNGDGLIDADTLAVNALIYDSSNPMNNDPRLVAAAATRFSAGPPPLPNTEDGAVALQIADLAASNQAALSAMRFAEFMPDALATIGARIATARTLANEGGDIVGVLKDAIQRETGVNLDEELIEMLSAQRAYQAASRLFNTVDEMIQTVLTLGR
jgi:flagellar hook-associated protein 1 FlgK